MRKSIARRALAGGLTVAAAAAITVWAAGTASAVGSPTGFGAGTTGGGSASPVTVSSGSALISAMQSSNAAVIRINGMLSISGMQDVGSNKTLIGVGSGSGITGGGLDVDGATNVIIQNLNFRNWSDDAINVQDASTRIWIDHNDFNFNGADGALDIKRASDNITVSWNKFSNHDKTALLGHSDGNGSQDRGHLRVSYHHNWFNGTTQRHPRVRFGNPVHVYNNFYGGVRSYGVASTVEGGVLVEGNYFENTSDAYHCGEGSSPAGALVARNNTLASSAGSTSGCTGTVRGIPYGYSLDPPANVKSIVTGGAGVGRLGV
ncbi:MAG TPA: right-handed parallel beta-helix repeat-containing protein [Actinophytocola sp.]|uniref:pectate lyase family protein n=1 Tax=Actinophytocola sp. TaxID=1872138 RepID=UPI002DB9B1DC|nr:right-handed parallel beta-helix repeat-containing protein [Actinophytocola sp.]HEU5469541.1 right-handed parallel beta-helix repeat-containing protein [Actinophytocola sp.]